LALEPLELLKQIRDRVDGPTFCALNPLGVAERHAELRRGGFGSSSIPEGSRGAEPPIPVTSPVRRRDPQTNEPTEWWPPAPADAVDRELAKKARRYSQHIANALRELDSAFEIQGWFLTVAIATPTVEEVICANPACTNLLERGLKSGECQRCRKHKHRFGVNYPKKPAEAAAS
jgi:hypothetical protein